MVVQQTTKTLCLFIFSVASCITTTIAQDNSTTYHPCNPGKKTSSNFQKSLADGINDLKSAAESNLTFKYYSPVYDGYTRLVHVSYLCQSDISRKNCFHCISRATKTAESSCSNWSTEAVVYEEECTFRYSDKPFYGRFDNFSLYIDLDKKALNPNSVSQFAKALNETVEAIETSLRSSPNYGVKFKTEEAKVDDKTTLYAMGECTWDLYQEDCRLCIHECASKVVTAGKVGGRVMLPSCNFRYNTTRFYDEGPVSRPPPPPGHGTGGQTPPLPLPQLPRPKRNKVDKKAAAAGSGGGVGGLLIGSALSWAYQKRKAMRAFSGTPEDDGAEDESPTDDENPGPPAGEETGSEQAKEEESKRRNRKKALTPSKGNKKNAAKKHPRR